MKIVLTNLRWFQGYFRSVVAHLQETCDGLPRLVDRGDQHRMVSVAVCGVWLSDNAVGPDSAVVRCEECRDAASRIGGIV
ncbi:hypothetical protein [Alloactinosynnema sp. L-07]|nr:hypothetical protein [Alloactinosynnema sp. L-07]